MTDVPTWVHWMIPFALWGALNLGWMLAQAIVFLWETLRYW